jgi:hypothetical protein
MRLQRAVREHLLPEQRAVHERDLLPVGPGLVRRRYMLQGRAALRKHRMLRRWAGAAVRKQLLRRGGPVLGRGDVLSGGAGVRAAVLRRGAEVHANGRLRMKALLCCASFTVLLGCGARSGLGIGGAAGVAEGGGGRGTSADAGPDASAVPAIELALGEHYSCLRRNGSIACWGENDLGELGDGTNVQRPTPVSVLGITDAVGLSPGSFATCAPLGDGTARCWGRDTYGEVGDGASAADGGEIVRPSPVEVPGLAGIVSLVDHGDGDGNCAVLSDGTVHCWGNLGDCELGQGTSFAGLPAEMPALAGATEIVMGGTLCARWGEGPVECCGGDIDGDLGDGMLGTIGLGSDGVPHPTLAPVVGLSGVIRLVAGPADNCAELADQRWVCWGYGTFGQLGDGTPMNQPAPVPVEGLPPGALIQLGVAHSCALLPDGTVSCWGANDFGQLGDGTNTPHLAPAPVAGLANIVEIALGAAHACARMRAGRIYCWGDNEFGQLGDGTTVDRSLPTEVFFP